MSDGSFPVRPGSGSPEGGPCTDDKQESQMTDTQTMTKAEPAKVLGGVVPYLNVDGAAKAAQFYVRAFGAEIVGQHPPDDKGKTMHIHLYINGGSVMLSDFYPDYGFPVVKQQGFSVMLPVEDIDFWWERAVAAGAAITTPLQVMFWGDRYGALKDPFGIDWSMNAPVTG
jgi:PhnB protein